MTVKPGFTPRKAEVETVAAVLEDPTFESPEQMAKAVLSAAAEILLDRELYVVYAKATPEVGWGPYFTPGKATEAWLSDVGPACSNGQPGGVVPVHPFPEAYVTGLENPTDLCACGHARYRHTTEGAGKRRSTYRCGSRKEGCHCAGFTTA